MRRVHAVITGRVQGVSFRACTAEQARRLGVSGWVRNLPDDSVELDATGSHEAIAALLAWCARGPRAARVDRVEVDELEIGEPGSQFAVRYD